MISGKCGECETNRKSAIVALLLTQARCGHCEWNVDLATADIQITVRIPDIPKNPINRSRFAIVLQENRRRSTRRLRCAQKASQCERPIFWLRALKRSRCGENPCSGP